MRNQLAIFSAMVLLLCSLARADSPSFDDLQKLYSDEKYKDLIPQINRVLELKGADAAQYNKYDLLMLKGNALLRTKAKAPAIDAFNAAAAATTDKADDSAVALATSELIRQSAGNLTYTRKTKTDKDDKPLPIDVLEPESRKLAFSALESDLEARVQPKVDAAVKSNSLTQIAQAAKDKDMVTLKTVEIAADGSANDTSSMLASLGNHAIDLMDAALDQLVQRLNDDVDAANNRIPSTRPVTHVNRNVLSIPQFIQEVNSIDASARQISDYAQSMSTVFDSTTDLKPVAEKSAAVHDAAVKCLKQAKAAGY